MTRRVHLLRALRFGGTVALAELGIAAAVGLACLIGGWRTTWAFGTGLVWAGAGIALLGLLAPYHHLNPAWSVGPGMAETVGAADATGRTRQAVRDLGQGCAFAIQLLLIGGISIAVGALVQGA